MGLAIAAWVVAHRPDLPARRALAFALAWLAVAQGIDAADDVAAWADWPILGRRGWGHEIAEDVIGRLGGAVLLAAWALRLPPRR